MRESANEHFHCDVTSVVLGRPAAFSMSSEEDALAENRLSSAAKIAGFKDIKFCPEPVAAAYDYKQQIIKDSLVLIADFGGGTSDFSIVQMGAKDLTREQVLGLGGISLAGDAYDGSIMKNKINRHFGTSVKYKMPSGTNVLEFPKFLLSKLNSPADINFLARAESILLLKNLYRWCVSDEERRKIHQLIGLIEEGLGYAIYKEIEMSKKHLSSHERTRFEYNHPVGISIVDEILRDEFLEFSHTITEQIMSTLGEVFKQAQIKVSNIDMVCLTGGTAQLKSIRQSFEHLFGREKVQDFRFFHSIINGLSVRARELS